MVAVPGALSGTSGHWRQQKRQREGIAADTLIRYTHTLLTTAGVDRSPAWVSRTARAYIQHGIGRCSFGEWLTDRLDLSSHQRDRAEVAYLLNYTDPTGEQACRNVMGERSA